MNEHNGWVPRDFWLEVWEKQAILEFHDRCRLEGYRRLTFMMLGRNEVAVSPASVWRVLHAAGRMWRWNGRTSSKGNCALRAERCRHGQFARCQPVRGADVRRHQGCGA